MSIRSRLNNDFAILLILYKRFEAIDRLIENLKVLPIPRVYIAIDGPKDPQGSRTREHLLIKLQGITDYKISVHVWQRETNLGLAPSVITAIDWFFSNEKKGVVIEDDIAFFPNFIEYVDRNFCWIDSSKRNMVISGTQYFPDPQNTSSVACNYPLIWGWATSRECWYVMRGFIFEKIRPNPSVFISEINQFFFVGAVRAQMGFIDTWDIPIAYKFQLFGMNCLVPPVPLTSNIGADSNATHTSANAFGLNASISTEMNVDEWNIDNSIAKTNDLNRQIETKVFKISKRNLLSLAKLLVQISTRTRTFGSLLNRIAGVSLPRSEKQVVRLRESQIHFW